MSETDFTTESSLNLNSNSIPQLNKPANQALEVDSYAKWYTRLAAGIIDILILTLGQVTLLLLVYLLFFSLESANVNLSLSLIIIALVGVPVLSYSYYGYFLSKNGITPGLKFIGLKLQTENGEYLTFWQAILRSLVFFAIQPVNIILILLTKRKQGLHDMLLKTVCLKTIENEKKAKIVVGSFFILNFIYLIISIVFGNIGEENLKDLELQNPSEMQNDFSTLEKIDSASWDSTEIMLDPDSQVTLGSEFYEACMEASKDSEFDISNYCLCAEIEITKTQDLNEIVSKCKNQIILR
jgi:uncharacterized RDD family membrane protein YckC